MLNLKTMIKGIVTDFSRVLLFPADNTYKAGLNPLNNKLLAENPDYDFWQYFRLNEELLEYYASLTLPVYIFTSETIQDHPAVRDRLAEVFRGVISAKKLGFPKTDPKAYASMAEEFSISPDEILYIDDKQDNINAASKAGCSVALYKANKQVESDVSAYLQLGRNGTNPEPLCR